MIATVPLRHLRFEKKKKTSDHLCAFECTSFQTSFASCSLPFPPNPSVFSHQLLLVLLLLPIQKPRTKIPSIDPLLCTSVFPLPPFKSSHRYFCHRHTFCAGYYTSVGIRQRQRVGNVYPWHFFLLSQYRLPSCHLFFFLIHFHIHAYNLLRPYRIIEFYYMLSWICSHLKYRLPEYESPSARRQTWTRLITLDWCRVNAPHFQKSAPSETRS
jgi:hypothetical protein